MGGIKTNLYVFIALTAVATVRMGNSVDWYSDGENSNGVQ
jgi:hypothetical protein